MVKIPSIDVDSGEEYRESSLPPEYRGSLRAGAGGGDPDTASLRSHISENSFKTASSEPQLNLVPRQGGVDLYDNKCPHKKLQKINFIFETQISYQFQP
jgi:hypothetical protein